MTRLVLAIYRVRIPLYYAAAVVLIGTVLFVRLGFGDLIPARRPLVLVAFAGLALSAVLAFACPRLLPVRERLVVESPVRGRWLAMNSPQTKVPSHGVRAYGQTYAIDLVFEPDDAERPAFGKGPPMRAPADYPAFGQPVFAMTDGVVVRATDWRRDHRSRSNWLVFIYLMIEGMIREIGGPGFIVGNHVIIRSHDGVYALVAHLQKGSLRVRRGDEVRAGQQIARCGNSGNTSEPHVHAQLMDRASPWTGQGIPMAFAGIRLGNGADVTDSLPANDQHMSS